MRAKIAFGIESVGHYIHDRVLERWQSLDRGWKAAFFGFIIVLGHLVAPL